MKKMRKKIILSLFFILAVLSPTLAQQDSLLIPNHKVNLQQKIQNKSFNLANIMDNLFANETKVAKEIDTKVSLRKDFITTTSKFNQGNAKVAYDEYVDLINKIDNDTSLLILSRIFYEIGYFSLANKSTEKILYKNQFYDNILDLENSYKTKAMLSVEEEIYFAKLYSKIYFNNSSDEAIAELLKKKADYQKHDFYHYTLSRAYLENKQFNQALHEINKAISLNQKNINYQVFKIDALTKAKKYKEALKQIEKLEKNKTILAFLPKIELQKQTILSYSISNSKEKKYHIAYKTFLEGNYEKTKKDCLSILNFDKDNDKIISLYAKSELATGNIERANIYFVNSYKLNKNNIDTIIGLGDIRYIHGDYKNAIKMYKKAYKADKNNYEAIIKLATAQRQHAKYPKEIKKLETKLDKIPKGDFIAYYNSAISIAQKNSVLKEDFLKRAFDMNPLYENTLGQLIEINLKNKNFNIAKNLVFNASFTLEKNYYFYYLCGLHKQALGEKQEAMKFYKTSLNLNPSFEIANIRLLKLIPDLQNEEI